MAYVFSIVGDVSDVRRNHSCLGLRSHYLPLRGNVDLYWAKTFSGNAAQYPPNQTSYCTTSVQHLFYTLNHWVVTLPGVFLDFYDEGRFIYKASTEHPHSEHRHTLETSPDISALAFWHPSALRAARTPGRNGIIACLCPPPTLGPGVHFSGQAKTDHAQCSRDLP